MKKAVLAMMLLCVCWLPAACAREVAQPDTEQPAEQPAIAANEFRLTSLPKLEAFTPFTGIGSRYYEEYTDTLLPSAGYGKIYPYVGRMLNAGTYASMPRYGLATADGQIVVDPVYAYFNYQEYKDTTLLCLYYPEEEYYAEGQEYPWYRTPMTIAATDGSWAVNKSNGYLAAADRDAVVLLDNDSRWLEEFSTYVGDVYVYSDGELLLELKEVAYQDYAGGVLSVSYPEQDNTALRGVLLDIRGNVLFDGADKFSALRTFYQGCAPAQDAASGLWGLIDAGGNYLLAPTMSSLYLRADTGYYDFSTPDGSRGLLKADGAELYSYDGSSGWYNAETDPTNGHLVITVESSDQGSYLLDLTSGEQSLVWSKDAYLSYVEDGWYCVGEYDGSRTKCKLLKLTDSEPRYEFTDASVYAINSEYNVALVSASGYLDGVYDNTARLLNLSSGETILEVRGYIDNYDPDQGFLVYDYQLRRGYVYDWQGQVLFNGKAVNNLKPVGDGLYAAYTPIYGGLINADGTWLVRVNITSED